MSTAGWPVSRDRPHAAVIFDRNGMSHNIRAVPLHDRDLVFPGSDSGVNGRHRHINTIRGWLLLLGMQPQAENRREHQTRDDEPDQDRLAVHSVLLRRGSIAENR